MNKVFYFNNIKLQEKIKIFQNIFDKKINFTLKCSSQDKTVKENTKKPFKSNSWSDSKALYEKELKLQSWFLK